MPIDQDPRHGIGAIPEVKEHETGGGSKSLLGSLLQVPAPKGVAAVRLLGRRFLVPHGGLNGLIVLYQRHGHRRNLPTTAALMKHLPRGERSHDDS